MPFFESQDNLISGNKIYRNQSAGIRVRNSWNVRLLDNDIYDNAENPVIVYSVSLEGLEPDRDFKLDPYERRAEASIYGGTIKNADTKPDLKIDEVNRVTLSGVRLLSGGPIIADNAAVDQASVRDGLNDESKSVAVDKRTVLLTFMEKIQHIFQ